MSFKSEDSKLKAIALKEEGLGPVAIGTLMNIPHQTVSGFLNKVSFKSWWQEHDLKQLGGWELSASPQIYHSGVESHLSTCFIEPMKGEVTELQELQEEGPDFYHIVLSLIHISEPTRPY